MVRCTRTFSLEIRDLAVLDQVSQPKMKIDQKT